MNTFVGRERELGRLQSFFDTATAGRAQVCFVAGEAGDGKTTLVSEFVRRIQARDEHVLAALGQCNAQTGAGDAYLPFREALAVLTGVADERATAPVSTADKQKAERLKDLLLRSVHVLVEFGPDLVGTLVPGTLLIAKFGKAVAQKAGLLDELNRLVKRKTTSSDQPALEQSRLFEQYAHVLVELAKEQPIILVLDDLHWADVSSLGLLFHLTRNLSDSQVMIVGTYRSDEVALGRGGQRHPLESVLNEIKRYLGDVVIDLGTAQAAEGRTFVDALVDTEPNRLDEAFRRSLFEHTDGQALFTTETLHNLQERGDLVRDAGGRWVQIATLDWGALPARVEGVIAERIGRLEQNQRDMLSVGSVVGADFAAQVVARVQKTPERDLLRQLSRELEQRHHLVQEEGEVKVGTQFMSLYRFTHALFQQYLYNELGRGERRILHADVAAALEQFYTGDMDTVVVQLAQHYTEAGDDERAATYAVRAGDSATRGYAFAEARIHYAQALEGLARLPDSSDTRRSRVDTIVKFVAISHRTLGPGRNLELLRQAEGLLAGLNDDPPDRLRLARVHYWMAEVCLMGHQLREAEELIQRVLPITRELNATDLLTEASFVTGRILYLQGRFDQVDTLLAQVLSELEHAERWYEWIHATAIHAVVVAQRGRYAEGIVEATRALERAIALKSLTGLAMVHSILALLHITGGDARQALEQTRLQLDAATQAGDRLVCYGAYVFMAWAHLRLGDLVSAERDLAEAQAIVATIGGSLLWTQWFASVHAELALRQGCVSEALALAEQMAGAAQAGGDLFTEGWALRVQGEAEAGLTPPRWGDAEAHLTTSLRAFERGDARLEAARTHLAWGRLTLARGDVDTAQEHLERAVAQFEASGVEQELSATRTLLASVTRTP